MIVNRIENVVVCLVKDNARKKRWNYEFSLRNVQQTYDLKDRVGETESRDRLLEDFEYKGDGDRFDFLDLRDLKILKDLYVCVDKFANITHTIVRKD